MTRHFRPRQAPPPERDTADIRRTDKHLALLDARLATGTEALPQWLRANLPADATTRTMMMMRIAAKGLGRDVNDQCREALCL